MPQIFKWMEDSAEKTSGSAFPLATITETSYLHHQLKRVRMEGDFGGIGYRTGQPLAIRVDERNYRNYIPSLFDKAGGAFEILFHLHGNGPGSRLAAALQEGDRLPVITPGGRHMYRSEYSYHFFFGDETTFGLFNSLKDEINRQEQNYIGVLELAPDMMDIPDKLGLMVDCVARTPQPAVAAISYLDELEGVIWNLWKRGAFYLMGNGVSVQCFRDALLRRGIDAAQIITQPYWMDGKAGL